MIEPIIGFSLFFFFVVFMIKTTNKNREKQYEKLIEGIKEETELYIEQTKTSTMTIGLENKDYLFNRCDLYMVKDALIILGFDPSQLFNAGFQLSFLSVFSIFWLYPKINNFLMRIFRFNEKSVAENDLLCFNRTFRGRFIECKFLFL
jgi:hypothetical protein